MQKSIIRCGFQKHWESSSVSTSILGEYVEDYNNNIISRRWLDSISHIISEQLDSSSATDLLLRLLTEKLAELLRKSPLPLLKNSTSIPNRQHLALKTMHRNRMTKLSFLRSTANMRKSAPFSSKVDSKIPRVKNFINGQFVDSLTKDWIPLYNPGIFSPWLAASSPWNMINDSNSGEARIERIVILYDKHFSESWYCGTIFGSCIARLFRSKRLYLLCWQKLQMLNLFTVVYRNRKHPFLIFLIQMFWPLSWL